MGAYRELLATPGVWRLTLAVLLSRLSVSMLSLAILVAATQLHGYANAGLLMLALLVATAAQLVAVLVTVAAVAGLRRPHPVNT